MLHMCFLLLTFDKGPLMIPVYMKTSWIKFDMIGDITRIKAIQRFCSGIVLQKKIDLPRSYKISTI